MVIELCKENDENDKEDNDDNKYFNHKPPIGSDAFEILE